MHQLYRSVPLVWRSRRCAQLGVDDPVLIDGLTAADAELLDLIRRGVTDADYRAAAESTGAGESRAQSLLELLREAGALKPASGAEVADVRIEAMSARTGASPESATLLAAQTRIGVCGPLAEELVRTLTAAGLCAEPTDPEAACAAPAGWTAVTSLWTHSIGTSAELQRRDLNHVAVRIGDAGADVVPVVPGATPCLTCAVLGDGDAEQGWQRGWIGLREASSTAVVDPLLTRAAIVVAAGFLRDEALRSDSRGEGPRARLRISADGFAVTRDPLTARADCDCLTPRITAPSHGGAESITAEFGALR